MEHIVRRAACPASRRRDAVESALDGECEVALEIGLLDHRGARSERANPQGVAANEDMRDEPTALDSIDGVETAALA